MDQSAQSKKDYQEMVKRASPDSRLLANCLKAFAVGGLICVLGQFVSGWLLSLGLTQEGAGTWTSVILIFLSVLFTGFGLYGKLGKFAGAGSIVPITGFANSVASPAVEYKKEGYILGVGAKMFLLAGPVIVYGTLASMLVGIVHYFWR